MLSYVIVLLVGILIGAIWVTFCPLPIPIADKGHRLFGVRGKKSAYVVCKILAKHGVRKRWSMRFGPTHQIVMKDNSTVICWFDEGLIPDKEMNAISLVCTNPKEEAALAQMDFQINGYYAEVSQPPGIGDTPLYIVKSDALVNSVLAFRKHALKMPKPETE